MSDLLYALASDNIAAAVTPVAHAGTTMNAGFPLSRAVDGDPGTAAKTTSTGDSRFVWPYATPTRVDGVWIPMLNAPAGTVIRWEGHTSNAWGAPVVSRSHTVQTYRGDLPCGIFIDVRDDPDYSTAGLEYWSLFVPNGGLITAVGEVFIASQVRETVNLLAPLDESFSRNVTLHPRADGGFFKYDRGTDRWSAVGRVNVDSPEWAVYREIHDDAKGQFSPFAIVLDQDEAVPEGLLVQWVGDIRTQRQEGRRLASFTWAMVPRGRAL